MNIYGCDSVIETDLNVHSNSVINLGLDTTIYNTESILLDPGTFDTYLWSESSTTQTLLVDTNNFIVGANEISVLMADTNGCTASDTIVVILTDCTGIESHSPVVVINRDLCKK